MRKTKWIAMLLCIGLILGMMPAAVFAGTDGGTIANGSAAGYTGTYDGTSGILKLVLSFQSPDIGAKGITGLLKVDANVLTPCDASGTAADVDLKTEDKKQALSGSVEGAAGSMVAAQYGYVSGGELYIGMEIAGVNAIDCTAKADLATIYFKVADKTKLNYKSIQLPTDTTVLDKIVKTKKNAILQVNSAKDKAIAYLPQASWVSGLSGKITGYTFAAAPTVVYPGSDSKPSLGGTVTLTAESTPAKAGTKLTATVSGTATTENLIYTWKRGTETIASATGTTYTAADADKGKEISVVVSHADYGAISSNAITICDVPGAPASVTGAIAGENTLRFTWTAPANNGGTKVTGYELTVTDVTDPANPKPAGSFKDLTADTLEQTVEKLTDGHQYKAAVKAKNDVGPGAEKESAPITMVNAVGAAAPVFTTDLSTEPVSKEYGDELTLTVAADVADKAAEEAKGAYAITYQWYEGKDATGADAEKIEGATAATFTTKVTAGTRYFYCIANNHNDLSKVTGNKGEMDAKTQSATATVNTTAKNLNAAGISVNKTATIYKNTALKLSDLLKLDAATAGSVPGETVDQILDVAAGKVSDGAIVTFRKSTDPATAAAIVYADVIKTNGTYTYTVNIPAADSSTNYILSGAIAGEGTLTVKTKSSGGGGGGGGGSSSSGSTTTTTTDVKKDISSSGSASISASELKNAKSVEAKNSQITVSLNQSAVNTLDKTTGLIIKTEKKSGTTLNDAAKELLGSRPVFDVTATQNGKAVTDFGSGKITISIAYAPTGSEDTAKLFLYYINDKDEAEKVSGSKYDGSLKAVTGQTSHLSSYAVGYDKDAAGTTTPVTPGTTGLFRDVSSSDWFYTAVMDLAGKEILSGVPDEDAKGNPTGTYQFRPQANVTRAEFATMLAKAAGANLSQYSSKTFNDVSADDWYAGAVGWASSVGVASGTGGGSFSPNANITRQDMAVMISKYAANVAEKTLTAKNEKVVFTDAAQIESYAAAAVETMQTAGIISGTPNEDAKGNPIGTYQFRPFANATRAEAAAMIYGLLQSIQ